MARKKKDSAPQIRLQPLSQEELDAQRIEIGRLLRKRRESMPVALNVFCSDLGNSDTRIAALEKHGANVNLNLFLQMLHGVGIRFEDLLKLLTTPEPADPGSSTATPT